MAGFFKRKSKDVLESARDYLSTLIETADQGGIVPAEIPPEGDGSVAQFVLGLFEESQKWRQSSMEDRFLGPKQVHDPVEYWKYCRYLEAGNHWEVWGTRKDKASEWKHELVDDETGDQIRAKSQYLTANWHDISIMPNIKNINDIFDEERKMNGWGQGMIQGVKKMKVEGTVIWKDLLDRTDASRPIITSIVCDNESIFPSKDSRGLERLKGCWYMVYATMQNAYDIKRRYPKLDISKIATPSDSRVKQIAAQEVKSAKFTKQVDELELWMDDDELIDTPYDKEETDLEHALIHQGDNEGELEVNDFDNNPEHIKAHLSWLDEIENTYPLEARTPEDQSFVDAIKEFTTMHIQDHLETDEASELPSGKTKKYPKGRKIVIYGGNTVAEDIPNPFNVDWRDIFHKCDNEHVSNSFWGRSDAEVLARRNETEDTLLSRMADHTVLAGNPKPWLHENDRAVVEKNGWDNDPTKPGYYSQRPPIYPTAQSSPDLVKIYQAMKVSSEKALGVTQVTYGQTSPGQSGDAIQLLMQQNQNQVTGEANKNLNDCVEGMVETYLNLYKQFYVELRYYPINGQIMEIDVSKLLTKMKVVGEDGRPKEVDIPLLQISVKPNSNFPFEWEKNLQFLLQLASVKTQDGIPLISREAILQYLSIRFPEYGIEGKYYKMSEALQTGLKIMQQEQLKQQVEERTTMAIGQKLKSAGLKHLLQGGHEIIPQPKEGEPTNGTPQK